MHAPIDRSVFGLCFSVSNWPVPPNTYKPALMKVAYHAQWLRMYNAYMPGVLRLAKKFGLKTVSGAPLEKGRSGYNKKQVERLIREAKAGLVDLAVVGNECLYENGLSADELIEHLKHFKKMCPELQVATAQVVDRLLLNRNVIKYLDVVCMQSYPFWDGKPVEQALATLQADYFKMVEAAEGKPVWITETGWPSSGETITEAVPSVANAEYYFRQVTTWARVYQIPLFWFEAVDEEWKQSYEGCAGAHWGLFEKNGVQKFPWK